MKVYIDPKNRFAKEPESEVDELTLFPENDIDRQKCQTKADGKAKGWVKRTSEKRDFVAARNQTSSEAFA